MPRVILRSVFFLSLVVLIGQCACAVPQRPGKGRVSREIEPITSTGYWLYLPDDYIKNNGRHPENKRWPLVITLHGLRPYDDAQPQIREWQQEGDRYGFIIIAPELRTCDSLTMQFPLRDANLPYVQKDERAVMAIMDEVFRRTNADPSRVLVTSFSSGGYLAHYLVNRYPERFSCLAVRGSNFNDELLSPIQLPKYRDMKIGIFWGENDFKVCREESKEAVDWYRRHHFDVNAKYVEGLGHERRPETAAAFYASTINVHPKTAPATGTMVVIDYPGNVPQPRPRRDLDRPPPFTPRGPATPPPAAAGQFAERPADNGLVFNSPTTPPRAPAGPTNIAPAGALRQAPPTVPQIPKSALTPKRVIRQPYSTNTAKQPAPRSGKRATPDMVPTREQSAPPRIPARIDIIGDAEGVAPMWINMIAQLPPKLREGATIRWLNNELPMSQGTFDMQGFLSEPGEHVIQAQITTADDRRIILQKTIKVFAPPASQPANS